MGTNRSMCTPIRHIQEWRYGCRGQLKSDGTRPETRFHLSEKRTSPFKSAGASVQSTTGSRGVRISGSNAGYTMFRGSVKGTVYPLHSPVSPSLPLPCVTVCHQISTGVYSFLLSALDGAKQSDLRRIWCTYGRGKNPVPIEQDSGWIPKSVRKFWSGEEKTTLGWILFRASRLTGTSLYGFGTLDGPEAASIYCIYPSCLLWHKSWRRCNDRDSCYCTLERARGAGNKEINKLKKNAIYRRLHSSK